MFLLKQLFFGLLLPAVVSGGIFIAGKSIAAKTGDDHPKPKKDLFSGWLIAAALSVGYLSGYLGLEGIPPFPPREGIQWLFYLAGTGLILGAFWHIELLERLTIQLVFSVLVPRLLLQSMFKYTWVGPEQILWWICLAAALFIFWNLVQQSFTLLPSGASSPFVYFGLTGGTALVLAVSGSLRLAQHCGIMVAIFAVIWILALIQQRAWPRTPVFPPRASPLVALLLIGIWLNGAFYEEVPAASAGLLAIALLAAQVGKIKIVRNRNEQQSTFIQLAAIALLVIVAIGIALARFGDSSGGY